MDSTIVHLRNYLRLPVVDYYARILENVIFAIVSLDGLPFIQKWVVPGPQKFGVCLSHDIDHLAPDPLGLIVSPLQAPDFHALVARTTLMPFYLMSMLYSQNRDLLALLPPQLHRILRKHESFWRLEEIISSELQLGVRSSFFFLPSGSKMDSNYDLSNPLVSEAIKQLSSAGFEVALHAGFSTAVEPSLLSLQKKTLEEMSRRDVIGVRAHYLRFAYPKTFREFVKRGFGYDSSVAFNEEVGYRASTCFPWMMFDIDSKEELPLVEIAPIIMDSALKYPSCMNLIPTSAQSVCSNLLKQVADLHGILTIVWHNRLGSVIFAKGREDEAWWHVYRSIIKEAFRRQGRVMTLREVFSYYTIRKRIRIVTTQVMNGVCYVNIESPLDYATFAISVSLKSGNSLAP